MAKDYAKAFYNSDEWDACRKAYRASVGGLCERCMKKGIVKRGDVVHHKKRLDPENIKDPSVALNFDNLELLCADCHAEEHTRNARRYRWIDGRLVPPGR